MLISDSSSLWKDCVCSGKLGSCSYTAEIQRIVNSYSFVHLPRILGGIFHLTGFSGY